MSKRTRYVVGAAAAAVLAYQTVHAEDLVLRHSDTAFGPGGQVEVGSFEGPASDIVDTIRTMETHRSALAYQFNFATGAGAVRVRFPHAGGELEVFGAPGAFEVVRSEDVPLPIPDAVVKKYPYAVRAADPGRLFVYTARVGGESLPLEDPIYAGPVEFVDVFFAQDPRSLPQAVAGGWCMKIWVVEFHKWSD